jgi:DeoR family transcriptional regulator, aga operon transcriptional repressor
MNSTSPLSSIERQNQILQLIARFSRVSINEVCETFSISQATARRDLETLAGQGKVQRVHGGAIPLRQANPEPPILFRSSEQQEEKQRIGRLAASLIADGEAIFLGSSTTVLEVAKNLGERHDLTVLTNSLPIINLLAGLPEITLVSLGGVLRKSELSLIGHITEGSLAEVRADKVFFGVRAMSLEHGLTNDYLPETLTDRAILGMGGQVIVVADYSKFGRVSTAFLAPLSAMHTLVTDRQAPSEFLSALEQKGIRILIA